MTTTTTAHDAGQLARAAYFAAVPEPIPLDFSCPRCRAESGQSCLRPDGAPTRHHAPRVDAMGRALNRRQAEATEAADAAYNVATYRRQGQPAKHMVRMLPQSQGPAYLVAKGWRCSGSL